MTVFNQKASVFFSQFNPGQSWTDSRWLFAVLCLLMVFSRPHPMSGIVHLADASNAIFFMAGLMQLPRLTLPLLMGLSLMLDVVSIQVFGTSSFCVSSAYGFLWLSYAMLWSGGHLLGRSQLSGRHIVTVLFGFLILQVTANLITSGSFYFLSGRFANPDFFGLVPRLQQYMPGYVLSGFCYVALFVGLTVTLRHQLRHQLRRELVQ